MFTFANASEQQLIEEKTRQLRVILNYVLKTDETFTQEFYTEFFRMFSVNVFRTLKNPLTHNEFEYDYEHDSDDVYQEPAWSHLRLIYCILIKVFLKSPIIN